MIKKKKSQTNHTALKRSVILKCSFADTSAFILINSRLSDPGSGRQPYDNDLGARAICRYCIREDQTSAMLFLSTHHTPASGPSPKLIPFFCIFILCIIVQFLSCGLMPELPGLGYMHLEYKNSVSKTALQSEYECRMGLQNVSLIMMMNLF